MLLTVLGAWLVCAVLVGIVFAAVGRSGLREDRALGHLPPDCGETDRAGDAAAPGAGCPREPLVARTPGEDAPGMTGTTAPLDEPLLAEGGM